MSDIKTIEQMVIKGEMSLVDFICANIDSDIEKESRNQGMSWSLGIQKILWDSVRDAKKNGKKLVFYNGNIPSELIAAFDCVGLNLDAVAYRLSTSPEVAAKYIDAAEKYVGSPVCSLCKTEIGAWMLGVYGVKPDVYVHSGVSCDSSRMAYPSLGRIVDVPVFSFDAPLRLDIRGAQYLGGQIESFVEFMQEHTGKTLDWDLLKLHMETANRNLELRSKMSELRRIKPCPLPGNLLALEGATGSVAHTRALGSLYQGVVEMGQMLVSLGEGVCQPEKHRVALFQNMIGSNAGVMDWMEEKYGAVAIMDAFAFWADIYYENLDDRAACFRTMGRKMQNNPVIHGSTGSAMHLLKKTEEAFRLLQPDVSIFLGHINCKHTWAALKMVTDSVQGKFGIPTLFLDFDCVDARYKSAYDVKAQIAEYFDTVVRG